ncbi:poly(U)-binding-splicing factor PUF60-like isoform X2 [Varroa jacobsoni]|nr:poly(U)-binding-splicing factor PUF60-like isoform X2 [Varroa destructor]XP_022666808.1 poly(U)-binding-splicing factor PUF60-like isoform X2 [Varroa destructor]XP_022666809.1 poly(U)-binding-splicing factor PUF60-like isoform X2 [Varroa destructor]XP_022666810.1 poly(U)-binding-splicing factor PUF60-like isoform X2 [Varroa destructor]XP_022666811.1 poly(U)-binding-splicing factor PUF60-like isoform X2 [Varroa destructor]XP_022666812.1 poly(U)-binding-splicing factor PUF60-like isoform X2 [
MPDLTPEQKEMVDKAKKYAMEQSIKTVIIKQTMAHSQQQKNLERYQALVLMCRIYVGSISYELREDAVRTAFKPFGPIKAINMSYDTVTRRHKGFAFVEFELPEAAQLALEQMNGVFMGGRSIKVGRRSNMHQAAPILEQILEDAKQSSRIYIASIHQDLSETDIHSVFEAFGKIKSCKLAPGTLPHEKHREYGFIHYETNQAASDAITSMNLFDLGGQFLRVGRAITPSDCALGSLGVVLPVAPVQAGPLPTAAAVAAAAAAAKIRALESSGLHTKAIPTTGTLTAGRQPGNGVPTVPGLPTANPLLPGLVTLDADGKPKVHLPPPTVLTSLPPIGGAGPVPPPTASTGSPPETKKPMLDESLEDGRELPLPPGDSEDTERDVAIKGGGARLAVMKKLMRTKTREQCVMILRNMVGEDEVDEDLEPEISEECGKFGTVNKVTIYKEKQGEEEDAQIEVKIFVEFSKTSEMHMAIKALHNRYFGGRQVIAEMYDVFLFDSGNLSA